MKTRNGVILILTLAVTATLIGGSSPRPADAKEKEPTHEVVILEGYSAYFSTNLGNQA